MDGREGTVRDFADRCSGIIMEAIKWAPETTRSLLQVSGDVFRQIKLIHIYSKTTLFGSYWLSKYMIEKLNSS